MKNQDDKLRQALLEVLRPYIDEAIRHELEQLQPRKRLSFLERMIKKGTLK